MGINELADAPRREGSGQTNTSPKPFCVIPMAIQLRIEHIQLTRHNNLKWYQVHRGFGPKVRVIAARYVKKDCRAVFL